MPDPREWHPDSAKYDEDLRDQEKGNDVPRYRTPEMQGRLAQIKKGQEVVNPRGSQVHGTHRARQPIIGVM